jgi:peptidoglycan hydrolase-like protein with peptidoglycan-binding domain
MRWLVMPAVGSCQLVPLLSSGAAGPVAISQPVGRGPLARNLADDVRTIQDALNQVTVKGENGGPMPFLAVDGICGPKTNAAISRFQQVQLKIFDGVIEPNKKTIIRLNEIIDPVSDEDLKTRLQLTLPIVSQAIAAALRNLQAVITSGPATTGPAATAADRLNRHFRLDTLLPAQQSAARIDLFGSYTRFNTVITNPEVFAIAAEDEFDLDKKNPKIALTTPKGFFEEGEEDPDTHKRLDRIHLGLGFFAPNVSPEFGAFIILHELSHFVSRSNGEVIGDFGRGWFDDIFMKPLPAAQRLANADSYAGFAHECRVDSAAKPAFVRTAPGGLGGAR